MQNITIPTNVFWSVAVTMMTDDDQTVKLSTKASAWPPQFSCLLMIRIVDCMCVISAGKEDFIWKLIPGIKCRWTEEHSNEKRRKEESAALMESFDVCFRHIAELMTRMIMRPILVPSAKPKRSLIRNCYAGNKLLIESIIKVSIIILYFRWLIIKYFLIKMLVNFSFIKTVLPVSAWARGSERFMFVFT